LQDRQEYLIPFKDTISAVFKVVFNESNEGITKNTVQIYKKKERKELLKSLTVLIDTGDRRDSNIFIL